MSLPLGRGQDCLPAKHTDRHIHTHTHTHTHTQTNIHTQTKTYNQTQAYLPTLTRVTGTYCLSVDTYLCLLCTTAEYSGFSPSLSFSLFKELGISRQSAVSVSVSLVCEQRNCSTPFGHPFLNPTSKLNHIIATNAITQSQVSPVE